MTLARRRVGAPAQRWFHGRRAYVCKRRPQGKGLETVRLLQRLGFAELGLHRIWGARSCRAEPAPPAGQPRLLWLANAPSS